jgi:GNAT superfamily N-acetyltransferase
MATIAITVHDSHPPAEAAMVDDGLEAANAAAAPLHEVRPIACFARTSSGELVGGAVGRRWGACCELQQLWVEPAHRHAGIATRLIGEFEAHARRHGCTSFYLETFDFQAPALYASLGYRVAYEHTPYPHGIVKFVMVKQLAPAAAAAVFTVDPEAP